MREFYPFPTDKEGQDRHHPWLGGTAVPRRPTTAVWRSRLGDGFICEILEKGKVLHESLDS
jgi:hypothetical protein